MAVSIPFALTQHHTGYVDVAAVPADSSGGS